MLNIYDDITYKWNVSMILIICEVIELRLYVVFNGRYVMYDIMPPFPGNLPLRKSNSVILKLSDILITKDF